MTEGQADKILKELRIIKGCVIVLTVIIVLGVGQGDVQPLTPWCPCIRAR